MIHDHPPDAHLFNEPKTLSLEYLVYFRLNPENPPGYNKLYQILSSLIFLHVATDFTGTTDMTNGNLQNSLYSWT
jgi:hypothetical protein